MACARNVLKNINQRAKSMENKGVCVVCKKMKTPVVFNIAFKAVHICTRCSRSIFLQEARWFCDLGSPQNIKETKIEQHTTHASRN
jgi:hypothetical protein